MDVCWEWDQVLWFVAAFLDRGYDEIAGAFVMVELTGTPYTQIIIAAPLLLVGADFTFNLLRTLERLIQATITAGPQISMIASIILCASIIVGIVSMTGQGVKITSSIPAISGNSLWLALILTMLACILS